MRKKDLPDYGKNDINIIARYIGIRDGIIDSKTMEMIETAGKMLRQDAAPAYVYAMKEIIEKEGGIGFPGLTLVLEGEDIKNLLAASEKAILLCATLGPKVDARIRQLQVNDVALALVYDASASVAIDGYCDSIQEEIKEKLPGYKHTMRFSPGYGDLPLEVQGDFLRAVNAEKRAGVSLTAGGMLTPIKTITAVFGLEKTEGGSTDFAEAVNEEKGRAGCGEKITCEECPRNKNCSMSALRS